MTKYSMSLIIQDIFSHHLMNVVDIQHDLNLNFRSLARHFIDITNKGLLDEFEKKAQQIRFIDSSILKQGDAFYLTHPENLHIELSQRAPTTIEWRQILFQKAFHYHQLLWEYQSLSLHQAIEKMGHNHIMNTIVQTSLDLTYELADALWPEKNKEHRDFVSTIMPDGKKEIFFKHVYMEMIYLYAQTYQKEYIKRSLNYSLEPSSWQYFYLQKLIQLQDLFNHPRQIKNLWVVYPKIYQLWTMENLHDLKDIEHLVAAKQQLRALAPAILSPLMQALEEKINLYRKILCGETNQKITQTIAALHNYPATKQEQAVQILLSQIEEQMQYLCRQDIDHIKKINPLLVILEELKACDAMPHQSIVARLSQGCRSIIHSALPSPVLQSLFFKPRNEFSQLKQNIEDLKEQLSHSATFKF